MQTQTLCKRWQRESTVGHVKQQQHSHTTGFWTLFLSPTWVGRLHPGACTKQQSPSLPHEGGALPSLQGILALPAMGWVSPQHYKHSRPWRRHPVATGCSRHCAPTYCICSSPCLTRLWWQLKMSQALLGLAGTSLSEGYASIKISSMTFVWIIHKEKIPGSNG